MRLRVPASKVRVPRLRPRTSGGVLAAVIALAVIGAMMLVAGTYVVKAATRRSAVPRVSLASVDPVAVSTPATVSAGTVEVPDLDGMALEEARTILAAAGFKIEIRSDEASAAGADRRVADQDPRAGTLVDVGTAVILSVETVAPTPKTTTPVAAPTSQWVVCIDPGHQAHSDASPEPVGPGSKTTKAKVTGGATGTETHIPEYEIALQISMNLKRRLEAQGVKVVMTRTTNDVNLSNAERAQIASRHHADLFVRIHGDGSPDSATSGISTLYPASNRWTSSFAARSKRAAQLVQMGAVGATGAIDRGIKPRQDLSGFNWATVPSVLVETGFLSNPVEDRLLASPHYQDKLAQGIADGAIDFLNEQGAR